MKLIVITTEYFFDGEIAALNLLFDNGMELLHLRKPEASESETVYFIEQIHQKYHPRIVVHDHFSLANRFQLKGIHLNSRNRNIPEHFQGTKSRSCHTINELEQHSDMDYLFLSPVFDSISKENYMSHFPESLLYDLKEKGVIHEKVIALGGVNLQNIHKVKDYGFGGVAVLGGLWEEFQNQQDTNILITRFKEFQHAAAQ
jgi:thiamine-phosphate pyrophosphorylase